MTFPSLKEHIYKTSILSQDMTQHLDAALNKELRSAWLLRNHLNTDLHTLDPLLLSEIWDRLEIIGFKSIRLNTDFSSLIDLYQAQLIFIIRHPLAVIASIKNRPNFWKDLGWQQHWNILCDQVSDQDVKSLIYTCDTDIRRLAFYWGYLHAVALDQLQLLGRRPIFYEDLYMRPYQMAEYILQELHLFDHPIHPAHLFTPSMVTMTTVHLNEYSKFQNQKKSLDFFWNKILSDEDIRQIVSMISDLCKYSEHLGRLCSDRNYLSEI